MARLQSGPLEVGLLIAQGRQKNAVRQVRTVRARIQELERQIVDCEERIIEADLSFEKRSQLSIFGIRIGRQAKSFRSFSRKRALQSLAAARDARDDLRRCRRLLKSEQQTLRRRLLELESAKQQHARARELYLRPMVALSA